MSIHLLRMAAGISDLPELYDVIQGQIRKTKAFGPTVSIYTRNMPKRAAELIDGGSVYSVIRSVIQCRRKILDVREIKDSQGEKLCQIVLEPTIIRVMPTPQKPFQGWRYLEPAKAPRDLGVYKGKSGESELPEDMGDELRALGLL